ncbi:hypothetical protein MYX65_07120 [Acidobacteria bacterium AH-259-L09]|nr:hypothetical protein [Acidobacteria bacterium AH-259-L09]
MLPQPIDELTMIWDGTQAIRVKAYKGKVASTLLANVDNVNIGAELAVNGYTGSPNDVTWEILHAGTNNKIAESEFHLWCSDQLEDCGKRQGNGKRTGRVLLTTGCSRE